jgi:hypothetical protein
LFPEENKMERGPYGNLSENPYSGRVETFLSGWLKVVERKIEEFF